VISGLFQPLLAVGLSDIIIGLIALIIVIIRQLIEANKSAGANRPKPPAVPQSEPPQANKGPVAAGGQQADPLRAQVEEFLRRASKPGQQNQARAQAAGSDIEVLVKPGQPSEPRTIGQPLRQADWRKPASPQPLARPDKARQSRGGKTRRRQSVAEHVAEQVSARAVSLGAQASQLGQRIAAEDQEFDSQIKAKFDHTLGTLGSTETLTTPTSGPPPADTPAAELAAMLASPGGIRRAVMLNEILRRPSERW
jgi:hypothetical protein